MRDARCERPLCLRSLFWAPGFFRISSVVIRHCRPATPDIRDMVKGIIFDCDGTLADSMPLHWRAWQVVLARHGLHLPEERFYSLGGVPSQDILKMLSAERSRRAAHGKLSSKCSITWAFADYFRRLSPAKMCRSRNQLRTFFSKQPGALQWRRSCAGLMKIPIWECKRSGRRGWKGWM